MEFFGTANALIGALVQGLRSRSEVPEWVAMAVLVVGSVVAYWLGTSDADLASKAFWQGAVLFVAVSAGIVQGVSSVANMANVKALKTKNGAGHGSDTKEG